MQVHGRAALGPGGDALKDVYQAPNSETALEAFDEFEAESGERYPAVIRLWRMAWEEFTPFHSLPVYIRCLVYTTNAIESLNARFRQVAINSSLPRLRTYPRSSTRSSHPEDGWEDTVLFR